jgi:poly-gamma-glutamate synthesis protein (capsule biosynthesis protein)
MEKRRKAILLSAIVNIFMIASLTCCTPLKDPEEIPPKLQTAAMTAEIPVETANADQVSLNTPAVTENSADKNLWWAPETILQTDLEALAAVNGVSFVESKGEAQWWLDVFSEGAAGSTLIFQKLFVLSAPFNRLDSEISQLDLENILVNAGAEPESLIWVKSKDLPYIRQIYKNLAFQHLIISESLPEECQQNQCLRINLFEESEPFWKILSIDGNNPLHDDFDMVTYPLKYQLAISKNPELGGSDTGTGFSLYTNYQKDLVTSLILTGTTALVRGTAEKIEENGLSFPSKNLAHFLASADITHISNEVPFYSACPAAAPLRKEMRFCSDPSYIQILKDVGADVIELTGNHLLDWGPSAFLETLSLYEDNGFKTYGGGKDRLDAAKPLYLSVKSNDFVFLGCNVAGPENDWATDSRPGALECNLNSLLEEVRALKGQGYLPIVTLQHYETEDFKPLKQLRDDFSALAQAGAVIVSGSQAHFPQGFDFVQGSFIHYGLGNLFFDQMDNWLRKSTVDVHYFYAGQYLNTEVIPLMNEDYGQPRFMTEEEAVDFMSKMYENSFYFLMKP